MAVGLREPALQLMTIHSAKGCEWDAVYVLHAADGNIPSDMSTGSDEEIEEVAERAQFLAAEAKEVQRRRAQHHASGASRVQSSTSSRILRGSLLR